MRLRRWAVGLPLLVVALFPGGYAAPRGAAPVAAQEPPAATNTVPTLAINPAICLPLIGANRRAVTTDALVCNFLDGAAPNMRVIDRIVGNNDGMLQPSDFTGIDLDGNQVHQMDDFTSVGVLNGSLFVIAFLPSEGPVTFSTNRGVFVPRGTAGSNGGDPPAGVGPVWTCSTAAQDPDCGTPDSCAAATFNPCDGVVVARLRARYGTSIAARGPGIVTIAQGDTDVGTLDLSVVGEPQSLSFTRLESKTQDGAGGQGQCPLPALGGFDAAGATAERAMLFGVVRDVDGTAITGAIVNWTTDDANKAVVAAPLTPTLDLGTFGFAGANIICGTNNAGAANVSARVSKNIVLGTAVVSGVDPEAETPTTGTSFTVVGPPANIVLSADPPAIPCDGNSSSDVTATITDADGTAVASGNGATFDAGALAGADPSPATTDGDGIARSKISPVASDATGVPVLVTVGAASASITIPCIATPTPTPTDTATPTPTDTATATPTATATNTDTPTRTSTTTPTATSTSPPTPSACVNFGQRVSLVLGILHRFGAHAGGRRYAARYRPEQRRHDRFHGHPARAQCTAVRPR